MATSDDLIGSARNYLKTTPKSKLYTYLFLFIVIVGGSIIGLSIIQKETYNTLFAGLSTEDASMVVAKLKELKVPYQLGAWRHGDICAERESLRCTAYACRSERAAWWSRNGF